MAGQPTSQITSYDSRATQQDRLPVILLMGPTASGKTGVAVHLAARFRLEIVSVDSAQVYRHMDIGTAKPSSEILAVAPHHLIDLLDPSDRYSAANFCDDANQVLAEIHTSGNIPLLTGGTMLYFKALKEGLSELPAADAKTRAAIDAIAEASGWPALHAELERIDPHAASRLRPTDAQRIQRALEVYYLTGLPLSTSDRSRPRERRTLPYDFGRIGAERTRRSARSHCAALRDDARAGSHRGTARVARAFRAQCLLCPRCVQSATVRSGNISTASSVSLLCAKEARQQHDSWPNAS